MKTLLLMRHAKSSWKDPALSDFERPLKKRGRKDAKRMAEVLLENDLIPDLILASSAARVRETVDIVAEVLDFTQPVMFFDELYMGESEDYVHVLSRLFEDFQVILVVGHNPGMEDFLMSIEGAGATIPTAGLAHLELVLEDWRDITLDSSGKLIAFWTPKSLEGQNQQTEENERGK